MKLLKFLYFLLFLTPMALMAQQTGTVNDLLGVFGPAIIKLDNGGNIVVDEESSSQTKLSDVHKANLRHKIKTQNNIVTHHFYTKSFRMKNQKRQSSFDHNVISYDKRDRSRWVMKMAASTDKQENFNAEVLRFDYNEKVNRLSVCSRGEDQSKTFKREYCVRYTKDFCKEELPALIRRIDQFDTTNITNKKNDFDNHYQYIVEKFDLWSENANRDKAKMLRTISRTKKINKVRVPDKFSISSKVNDSKVTNYMDIQKLLNFEIKAKCDQLEKGNYFKTRIRDMIPAKSDSGAGES